MRWPGASPRRKRSANCAICWMNMKGAGDDSDELGFPQRDAIFGMGSVHFLWQGTALAALAAAAMALCRRASARYLLGVGALGLMLLAPLATFFFYSQQ